MTRRLVTSCSSNYFRNLCSLIGSIKKNYRDGPQLDVYDIGLTFDQSQYIKNQQKTNVIKVPQFVPWWRRYFAWKIWVHNRAIHKDDQVMYIDSGSVVLRSLQQYFDIIDKYGYLTITQQHFAQQQVTLRQCQLVKVPMQFRNGKKDLRAGMIGYSRYNDKMLKIFQQALNIVMQTPDSVFPHTLSCPMPRHDQGLLIILFHKYIPQFVQSQLPVQKYAAYDKRFLLQSNPYIFNPRKQYQDQLFNSFRPYLR